MTRRLFRRCVQCPDIAPSCPTTCKADEVCTQISASCVDCARNECLKIQDSGATDTGEGNRNSDGPNVGAIVGAVGGGLVFIAIVSFLVWKFFIRNKQHMEEDDGQFDEDYTAAEKSPHYYDAQRSVRSSTHTSASRASTALTRASNFIQIAYIPGVTNRSGPGEPPSPDLLVPPVPPIPMATTGDSNTNSYASDDQHYFVPDLRDSTLSGFSLASGVDTHGRQSISPSLARSSVATTVYQHNAVVSPTPAQTVMRGKAAVVSVKPGQPNSHADTGYSSAAAPSLPPINQAALGLSSQSPLRQAGSGPASNLSSHLRAGRRQGHSRGGSLQSIRERTDGETASKGLDRENSGRSSRSVEKPAPLNVSRSGAGGWSRGPVDDVPGSPNSWLAPGSPTGEGSVPSSARPLMTDAQNGPRYSNATTIHDSPALNQSPFADNANRVSPGSSPGWEQDGGLAPRSYSPQGSTSTSGTTSSSLRNQGPRPAKDNMGKLAVVIEEAMKRASSVPTHGGLGGRRDGDDSPFSDEHTVDRRP